MSGVDLPIDHMWEQVAAAIDAFVYTTSCSGVRHREGSSAWQRCEVLLASEGVAEKVRRR